MAEIQDFVITDANNTGRWPENMQFSAVNNAGRADEGILARYYKDIDGSVTASGSSNAFTATSNRTIAAYFNNLTMTITANHTIDGAATLNLNGIGAKSIKRFNGDGLASGDITSGQPFTVIYKSSPDIWYMMTAAASLATGGTYFDFTENASPGTPSANVARLYSVDDGSGTTVLAYKDSAAAVTIIAGATQALMEAAASNTSFVTPGRQKYHPAHPKAWGQVDQITGPTLNASSGLSSITDLAAGSVQYNFTTAFSTAQYGTVGMCRAQASGSNSRTWSAIPGGTTPGTTNVAIITSHNASNNVDSDYATIVVLGDHA